DDDEGGEAAHVVEVVEHAKGRTQRAEMARGGRLPVEDRDADGLDVAPALVEGWDLDESVDVEAVPLEEDHGAGQLLDMLLEATLDIPLPRRFDHAPDFLLVSGGQVLQPIDPLVEVGQRQDVHGDVEG